MEPRGTKPLPKAAQPESGCAGVGVRVHLTSDCAESWGKPKVTSRTNVQGACPHLCGCPPVPAHPPPGPEDRLQWPRPPSHRVPVLTDRPRRHRPQRRGQSAPAGGAPFPDPRSPAREASLEVAASWEVGPWAPSPTALLPSTVSPVHGWLAGSILFLFFFNLILKI